jgi:uncharacterized membrane protein
MLFPVAPAIHHLRIALSFGIAVTIFAALGGLATFTTGAPLWKGLMAGAAVGAFFGQMLSGLAPGLVATIFGPEDKEVMA